MTIIVAGVPGVGKTTILQELDSLAQERKVPLKIVNFGDVMNQLFKKQGRRVHRDHMRRQNIALQARIQQHAARKISQTPRKSTLIVDTHMFVRTVDGIWPGTPRRVMEELEPDMIVLIEADPEDVARRRNIDTTRERETKAVEEVRADLEWSRYMASANSILEGVPIQIIQNREGSQHQAAEDLLKIVERLQ